MPLSSDNDEWTGDPEADLATLIARARASMPRVPPRSPVSALPSGWDMAITAILLMVMLGILFATAAGDA
jgi:hypothetical protein